MKAARLLFPALAACLAACDPMSTRVAGGGSEATNGQLSGAALYPDGAGAAWSAAIVRREGYLRDTLRWEREIVPDAVADGKGRWHIDSLDTGDYRLELRDGQGRAAMASVHVGPRARETRFDTLAPTGAVTGMLSALPQGQPLPKTAASVFGYAAVYGLEHIVRADAQGRFTLAGLPRGRHRLHFVSGRPGWLFADRDVTIAAGRDTVDVGILAPAAFAAEDYSRWAHSRRLRLAVSDLGLADTLYDFPLLLRLAPPLFDPSRSDGTDLRFAGKGGRHLDYEVEEYDAAAGRAAVWVRLDTLALADPDPVLTLYWGRPGAPDFSEGKRVFRSEAGAWHLGGRPGTGISAFADASPNGLDGLGDAASDTGVAARGSAFAKGSHVSVPRTPALEATGPFSFSAWIRADTADATGGDLGSMADNVGLRLKEDGSLYFFRFNDPAWETGDDLGASHWHNMATPPLGLLDDTWHHVAAVYDGAAMRLYADGREVRAEPSPYPTRYPFPGAFEMGRHGLATHAKDYFGRMDEARFSRIARSAAWLRVSYETQRPDAARLHPE
jgi:hypothetical protein